MSKKKKRRHDQPAPSRQPLLPSLPPAAPPAQLVLGYDPSGKMEQRSITGMKDGWSEYTLDDGSLIKVKSVIIDVKRAVDQYNAEGDPVYVLQLAFVNNITAPDHLKRKR